ACSFPQFSLEATKADAGATTLAIQLSGQQRANTLRTESRPMRTFLRQLLPCSPQALAWDTADERGTVAHQVAEGPTPAREEGPDPGPSADQGRPPKPFVGHLNPARHDLE